MPASAVRPFHTPSKAVSRSVSWLVPGLLWSWCPWDCRQGEEQGTSEKRSEGVGSHISLYIDFILPQIESQMPLTAGIKKWAQTYCVTYIFTDSWPEEERLGAVNVLAACGVLTWGSRWRRASPLSVPTASATRKVSRNLKHAWLRMGTSTTPSRDSRLMIVMDTKPHSHTHTGERDGQRQGGMKSFISSTFTIQQGSGAQCLLEMKDVYSSFKSCHNLSQLTAFFRRLH